MATKTSCFAVSMFLVLSHSAATNVAPTFLGANGSAVTSDDSSSSPSGLPSSLGKLDSTAAAMESAVTDLLLGKGAFAATPMGGSVKEISDLITKTMMPAVTTAHAVDQSTLNRLANEISKCGKVRDGNLKRGKAVSAVYQGNSKNHQQCRGTQAVQYASWQKCIVQRNEKYRVKTLKCNFYAVESKRYGTQKNNYEIMKKAGSETVEAYLTRISGTICGRHVHGPKGNKKDKGGWGGGLPNGFLDKYLRAKKACEDANKEYIAKKQECERKHRNYIAKKTECDQFQRLMDQNSCNAAVIVKDACESYSGCYYAKRKAYNIYEKKCRTDEVDRKAEWRGLKRMECLIDSFADGKVTDAEVTACKKATHKTDHLNLKYPKIPPLKKCALPTLYPATGAYKRKEFEPLPVSAKGMACSPCAGIDAMPTTPGPGSPKSAKCSRVGLNGAYSAGGLVKCTNGLDVYKSLDRNSCPVGTKLWSPASRADWATFLASAGPLRAPNWIIDVTRPQDRCGGCASPMNSNNAQQKSWQTSDGSPWWLRNSRFGEPNGDYKANCYLDLWHGKPRNADSVSFNDWNCKYHSKSYYCQPELIDLRPKKGSPASCACSKVDLSGYYTAGFLVKCQHCIGVSKSKQKNSCPNGMKIFSPASRADWKTFLTSAGDLRAPHWIIDITRSQNSCGGCTRYPMASSVPQQATWKTSDGSAWWLRNSRYGEPNGDYHANCYLALGANPNSADTLRFNDWNCNYHSRSYYCQPKKGTPNYGGHHRRRRAPPPAPPQKAKPKAKPKAPTLPRGVQKDFDQLKLSNGGWKVHSDNPYSHATQRSHIEPPQGDCVMWGSKRSSGDTKLHRAAFGRRDKIKNKKTVWENGVFWYTHDKKSNGFSSNNKISLNSCDTEGSNADDRLCWHLGQRSGGWRSGRDTGLNSNKKWRKVVMYGPCSGLKK